MHFKLIVTLLFLQPVFPQQCRQVTVCNETPRDMIKGDKGDTGNAGKAGPEGRKGETGSDGIKGEKGLPGESCALGSFGTNLNNKIAGSYQMQVFQVEKYLRFSDVKCKCVLLLFKFENTIYILIFILIE